MKRTFLYSLLYFDEDVISGIVDKYNVTPMNAARAFRTSKTHAMAEDAKMAMDDFGAPAIFDVWEVEKITGDPRNSIYIRGE